MEEEGPVMERPTLRSRGTSLRASLVQIANQNGRNTATYQDYLHAQRDLDMRRRTSNPTLMEHSEQINEQSGEEGEEDDNEDNDEIDDDRSEEAEDDAEQEYMDRRRLLRGMAAIQSRMSMTGADFSAWKDMEEHIQQKLRKHGSQKAAELSTEPPDDHDAHGGRMALYAPPVQRQRWGDDQVLPHVNWGDLFYDLFYVAVAYNLGVMLITAMNLDDWLRGIIYFVGIFGPLFVSWEADVYYSSRYTVVDYFHRLVTFVRFLLVSGATLHIKPLELLADKESVESFIFTLCIFVESLVHLALNYELYFRGQGDRVAIKNHTLRKIHRQLIPTSVTYLAAAVVAAAFFFSAKADKDDEKDSYGYGKEEGYDSYKNSTYGEDPYDGYQRHLAGENDGYKEARDIWELSDLPLTLTAIGYITNLMYTFVRKAKATSGEMGALRDHYVPNNIPFLIHRYGEWIM